MQIAALLPPHNRWEAQALVVYLVQRGADVNIEDKTGRTPFDYVDDIVIKGIFERYQHYNLSITMNGHKCVIVVFHVVLNAFRYVNKKPNNKPVLKNKLTIGQ